MYYFVLFACWLSFCVFLILVIKEYDDILASGDVPEVMGVIHVMSKVIDSSAGCSIGALLSDLKAAEGELMSKYNTLQVESACQLFKRFVTREIPLDSRTKDFSEMKRDLREEASKFKKKVSNAKTNISNHALSFIQDGLVL